MAEFPAPAEGIVLTHFIVASDVDRTRRFYADVLGGEVIREGEPSIVALANSWIVINAGGPPTDDKPTVTLEPPRDPGHVSSFLNIRVADNPRRLRAVARPRGRVHDTPCVNLRPRFARSSAR
jgi:catechol 2,3-dioxygenase-like lactoylglutathione lyase family enzyme